MNLPPQLILLGAPKAGTTSFYFYLRQHPGLFFPDNKEPSFFAFKGKDLQNYKWPSSMRLSESTTTTIESYEALFKSARKDQIRGDASTIYLSSADAPANIRLLAPNATMIAILRNPIDRAYSNFNHFREDGFEPIADFISACNMEESRKRENWYPSFFYLQNGMYAEQIKRYKSLFSDSQLKWFLYEDLLDPQKMLSEVFELLGLSTNVKIDTNAWYNRSGSRKLGFLYNSVRQNHSIKDRAKGLISAEKWHALKRAWDDVLLQKPKSLTTETRYGLVNYYRQDIMEVSELINRDLSSWLKV